MFVLFLQLLLIDKQTFLCTEIPDFEIKNSLHALKQNMLYIFFSFQHHDEASISSAYFPSALQLPWSLKEDFFKIC